MTQHVTHCRLDGDTMQLWRMVDDACAGEQAIKKGGIRYLPKLNPQDTTQQNEDRNSQYRARASYYNATGRTKAGLLGVAFAKDPTVILPAGLEYLLDNANGEGIGLEQVAQKTVGHVSSLGRAGMLADYPLTSGVQSKLQSAGKVATILRYHPRQIINWDTETVHGQTLLSLVVLEEVSSARNPGEFMHTPCIKYRVLELIDGIYQVRIFEQDNTGFNETANYQPTDATGAHWQEIPFTFLGSENNDAETDPAPLADLSFLNIAHYRNSADLEESSFFTGQPTYGLKCDQDWVDKHFSGGQIYMGSRSVIPLPLSGDLILVQAEPNNLPLELMKHKEEQMVRIGARLLMPGENVTATATRSSDKTAYSVLSICCANVSAGVTQCLEWCAQYMGVSGEVLYEISRDFVTAQLTSQDIQALMQLWQSGTTAKSDVRALLRKYELIDPERSDEDIDAELESQVVPLLE